MAAVAQPAAQWYVSGMVKYDSRLSSQNVNVLASPSFLLMCGRPLKRGEDLRNVINAFSDGKHGNTPQRHVVLTAVKTLKRGHIIDNCARLKAKETKKCRHSDDDDADFGSNHVVVSASQ
jgi:hypothetical protein